MSPYVTLIKAYADQLYLLIIYSSEDSRLTIFWEHWAHFVGISAIRKEVIELIEQQSFIEQIFDRPEPHSEK